MTNKSDIAIIGMSGLFPGAKDINSYWHNIINKVYSIQEATDDWAKPYFEPNSQPMEDLARIYTRQVGLLGDLAEFNPLEFGIPPTAVEGDPSHFLALKTAKEALRDANYIEKSFNREKTGIILGRGSNPNRGDIGGIQYGLVLDQTISIISQLLPELDSKDLNTLREQLKTTLPPVSIERVPNVVSNVAVGKIANRLDLMGPNYLIDAACASSLISVQLAIQELLNGRSDMMLAGGIQASMPPLIYQLFCQLNALSRTKIDPFSNAANGTLLGEGAGFLVLKRLEDAEKDGDRIYAIIKGVGVASDGKALGLLAPRLEGEILAIQRAYQETGIDCQTIDLIEAHGTGIPLGDETEIKALTAIFGTRSGNLPKIALGSVKSMIGHCIPAAGIASFIKMVLSLYYKTLPPTLCSEVNPNLAIENTPLYLNTEPRPWIHSDDSPRRAAINAFGFGGINSHAILEEYQPPSKVNSATKLPIKFCQSQVTNEWPTELLLFTGNSQEELINLIHKVQKFLSCHSKTLLSNLGYTLSKKIKANDNYRLAIIANDIPELAQKLNLFAETLTEENKIKSLTRKGIFYSQKPRDLGKIAFVFSSEGAQYPNMLADVCLYFPQVRQWFDLLDEIFPRQHPPSHYIFPAPTSLTTAQKNWVENQLYAADLATESLWPASMGLYELLCDLGIKYDVILGHSAGEHTAATASCMSKISSKTDLIEQLRGLNQIYQELEQNGGIPSGVVFSLGGLDSNTVENLLNTFANSLYLVADNCPNQMLLFVTNEASDIVMEKIKELGGIYVIQPFNRAYHTPLYEKSANALKSLYQKIELSESYDYMKFYSCATTEPYPSNPEAIRDLVLQQWSMPVLFHQTIKKLAQQGVKTFIEVGAGNNLTAFIDNILKGQDYQALATNSQRQSGLKQIFILLAKLFINAYPVIFERLYQHRQVVALDLDESELTKTPTIPILNLLLPKMELKPEFAAQIRAKLSEKGVNTSLNPNTIVESNLSNNSNTDIEINDAQITNNGNHQQLPQQLDEDVKLSILENHFQLMQEFLANQAKISSMIFMNNE